MCLGREKNTGGNEKSIVWKAVSMAELDFDHTNV